MDQDDDDDQGNEDRDGNEESNGHGKGNGLDDTSVSVSVGPNFFDKAKEKSEGARGQKADGGDNATGNSPTAPLPVKTPSPAKRQSMTPRSNSAQGGLAGLSDYASPPPTSPINAPEETSMIPTSIDSTAVEAKDDVEMAEKSPSPFDPLFDDVDAEGESILPSGNITRIPSPSTTPTKTAISLNPQTQPPSSSPAAKSKGISLALPGMNGHSTSNANANGNGSVPNQLQTQASTSSSTIANGPAPLFATPPIASSSRTPITAAARNIPLLTPTTWQSFSDDVMMTSSMDGQVVLIDRRVPSYSQEGDGSGTGRGVGRLMPAERTPPWCMSVSVDTVLKKVSSTPDLITT